VEIVRIRTPGDYTRKLDYSCKHQPRYHSTMPFEPNPLSRNELFHLLAGGHAAGVTVVTPNQRLAQSLQLEMDEMQGGAGKAAWEAPDVLHFGAFVKRCHDEALYSRRSAEIPALLGAAEEQILWEEALRASRWRELLLSIPATAALAADAWKLAHAWRIEGAMGEWAGNEDSEAFAAWRQHYERRTQRDRLTDSARLPAVVASVLPGDAIAKPKKLVLYAFDLVTPQQSDFLGACERAGIEVMRCEAPQVEGRVARTVFDSPRQELEYAARWARQRLEQGAARIAVVVPELAARRAEVVRVFARVLGAGFNISLGAPLASFALVDAGLGLLELATLPVDFDRASRLIRSPFIAGAESELAERARLDEALRRLAPATLTLNRLRALIPEVAARRGAPRCPRLTDALDALLALPSLSRGAPHEWARHFTAMLDAAGFPGERSLDSTEFQTLAKWREALATLATLGSVAPSWSGADARARLQRICADTLFQPASGEAPVQVLGILESAGLTFDHLWVSGLTEEAWPLSPRPHALIAPALQRKAGIPQASPERSLEVDRALTLAWATAAAEVLFTNARAEGDRELLPSPLVAHVPQSGVAALSIPDYPTQRSLLFAAGRKRGAMTRRADSVGPAVGTAPIRGGTAVLADQAACAFRAFAHFRLGARTLERPEPGLGPPERGQLLHAMMARLWSELRDQATLNATDRAALDAMIAEAAAHAVARVRSDRPGRLDAGFAQLERERLAGIAREWLEIERKRAPFEVRMREEKMTLAAGNLKLEGRVDRVDRLVDGGGLAVIDYKSGQVRVSAWLGARPDDAQLPLYALAAGEEDLRAVAFAGMKTGQLGYKGISREGNLIPGVYTVPDHRTAKRFVSSWSEMLATWRREIDRLGENFASGDARVDPKRALATCERCDLKPLCRVHERLGALAEDEDGEEVEDEE
jgi:probable DNA repair protein